jgi:hypothetical protein
MNLPTRAVVDMFGRLFGTILATLVEKCPSPFSGSGEGIPDPVRRAESSFTGPIGERHCSAGACVDRGAPVLNGVKSDLAELKKRLLELMEGGRETLVRSAEVDLSANCLVKDQGTIEFHSMPFRSDSIVDGLTSFLGRLHQGNAHDKGIISATGTPLSGGARHQARNATELDTDSYFCSGNSPNQWLAYDFKDTRVAATHYFLRSNGNEVGINHLRSWVLEASADGTEWKEIDRQENVDCLNGSNRSCVFTIRSVVEARFIRRRSIGPTLNGSHYLYVRAFELFGGLRLRDSAKRI